MPNMPRWNPRVNIDEYTLKSVKPLHILSPVLMLSQHLITNCHLVMLNLVLRSGDFVIDSGKTAISNLTLREEFIIHSLFSFFFFTALKHGPFIGNKKACMIRFTCAAVYSIITLNDRITNKEIILKCYSTSIESIYADEISTALGRICYSDGTCFTADFLMVLEKLEDIFSVTRIDWRSPSKLLAFLLIGKRFVW